MGDLIERLEAATVGSRELDGLLARRFGWHRVEPRYASNKHGGWIAPEDFMGVQADGRPRLDSLHGTSIHRDPPAYTTSLDAALALAQRVLPGEWMTLDGPRKYLNIPSPVPNHWRARIRTPGTPGWGATPALALCAAILRAIHEDKS